MTKLTPTNSDLPSHRALSICLHVQQDWPWTLTEKISRYTIYNYHQNVLTISGRYSAHHYAKPIYTTMRSLSFSQFNTRKVKGQGQTVSLTIQKISDFVKVDLKVGHLVETDKMLYSQMWLIPTESILKVINGSPHQCPLTCTSIIYILGNNTHDVANSNLLIIISTYYIYLMFSRILTKAKLCSLSHRRARVGWL